MMIDCRSILLVQDKW